MGHAAEKIKYSTNLFLCMTAFFRKHVGSKKALRKLCNRGVSGHKSTRVAYVAGTIGGGLAGLTTFGCPGGILASSYIGLMAGHGVKLKVDKFISKRALRERLKSVVGRPALAARLAKEYKGFPKYQEAILALGGTKLVGKRRSKKKQRAKLAAKKMKEYEIEKYI